MIKIGDVVTTKTPIPTFKHWPPGSYADYEYTSYFTSNEAGVVLKLDESERKNGCMIIFVQDHTCLVGWVNIHYLYRNVD